MEPRRLMCSIGDFVWLDADCDGTQDAGEAGVAGVQVDLFDGNGNFIHSTTTDANGYYLFQRLPDFQVLDVGTYAVKFHLPDGYHFSPADQGGGDDSVDSDAGADGSTGPIVLTNDNLHDLTVDAGLCVNEPPPPPPPDHLEGRMTGGGSVFLQNGTRVTHGFQLHCTTEANNRLEINWGKPNNHFHLADLTEVICEDTPIFQNPPDAPIDTMKATGVGRFTGTFGGTKYQKAPATVQIVFRDGGPQRGEPGVHDVASYKITLDGIGAVVLNTDGGDADDVPDELPLRFGNHQAHDELKRLTSAAGGIQTQINSLFDQLDSTTLSEHRRLSITSELLELQEQFEAANAG